MSTTTDLIGAAVLIGPGALLSVPVLLAQCGTAADSERVRAVLAASAAERAAALAEQTDVPVPPDGGEPVPAPVARLAPVIDLATRRAA